MRKSANKATFLIEKSVKNIGSYLDSKSKFRLKNTLDNSNTSSDTRSINSSNMKSNRKHMNILPFPNYNKRPQSTKKFSMPHQFANKVVPFDSRNMLYQNINQKQNYISDYLHPRITNTDSLDYLNPNFKMTPTTGKQK